MDTQEFIKEIKKLAKVYGGYYYLYLDDVLNLVNKLDRPEECHADKAPCHIKDILARLRELPLYDREVWLKVITSEFGQHFSRAKYNEDYEKGKIAGFNERNKPKVPQFVADWYEKHKDDLEYDIWEYILHWNSQQKSEFDEWMNYASNKPLQTLINMHQFGYEIKKEPQYIIKAKGISQYKSTLVYGDVSKTWFFASVEGTDVRIKHTKKQLEKAGFSAVFNSPLFEVEEVTE